MQTIQKILTLLIPLCVLSGCMTPGQSLDTKSIQQLHEGQSQGEVHAIFGPPLESATGGNGNTLELFQFVSRKSTSGRIHRTAVFRTLHVLYNAQGRVEKYRFHVGELRGNVGRDGKWRMGHPFDPVKLSGIQRGLTTRDELTAWFGPAAVEGLSIDGNPSASWYYGEGATLHETGRRELLVEFTDNFVVRNFWLHDRRK